MKLLNSVRKLVVSTKNDPILYAAGVAAVLMLMALVGLIYCATVVIDNRDRVLVQVSSALNSSLVKADLTVDDFANSSTAMGSVVDIVVSDSGPISVRVASVYVPHNEHGERFVELTFYGKPAINNGWQIQSLTLHEGGRGWILSTITDTGMPSDNSVKVRFHPK